MSAPDSTSGAPQRIGRYALFGVLASGGMARVHVGRLLTDAGFSKTVAIKRLHPHFASDPAFVAGLLDEARLVSRIRHPSVVPTLDVVSDDGELLVVMEYVAGESLGALIASARKAERAVPVPVATSIVASVLHGLHAAHEAAGEDGQSLAIVHRDVSPQNVLVGADGLARVLDFGVAKARGRLSTTGAGQVKGKLPYMSPEQLLARDVDRRTDVYAAGLVLWEVLTGRRVFRADDEGSLVGQVLQADIEAPSRLAPEVPALLDDLVLRAVAREPERRFPTARDFAVALEERIGVATAHRVAEWVAETAGPTLAARAALVAAIEQPRGPHGVAPEAAGDRLASPDEETAMSGVAAGAPGDASSGSQVSSLSVSSGKHAVPSGASRGSSRLGIAAVGLVVAAVAGIGLASWRSEPHPQAEGASSPAPPPTTATSTVEPSAATPVEPALPSASAREPATSDARAQAPKPPTAPPATRVAAPPSAAAPAPTASARDDCDPPFSIGPGGIRHLKKGCR